MKHLQITALAGVLFYSIPLGADPIQPTLTLEWAVAIQKKVDALEKELKTTARIPVGTIVAYAGAVSPPGWLFCDGSTIPGDYAVLRNLVGNETPNLDGRFLMGAKDTEQFGKLGGGPHSHRVGLKVTAGNRKGSDKYWGDTPWASGPNPVIGDQVHIGTTDPSLALPPFVKMGYIIKAR